MNKRIRLQLGALLLLAGFVGQAAAQRPGVPVVDFTDIPVSLSTPKAVTAEQVKQAIMTAAVAEKWDTAQAGDGVLRLTLFKNGKHTVVIKMPYAADKYSVIFDSADKMNYSSTSDASSNSLADAKRKQQELLGTRPEYKFSVARPKTLIHPNYEVWVHELLGSVRRQLQAIS